MAGMFKYQVHYHFSAGYDCIAMVYANSQNEAMGYVYSVFPDATIKKVVCYGQLWPAAVSVVPPTQLTGNLIKVDFKSKRRIP